jgi:hypothetical protein
MRINKMLIQGFSPAAAVQYNTLTRFLKDSNLKHGRCIPKESDVREPTPKIAYNVPIALA